jgi:flavin-dependent dehydrogenase
MFDVIVCGAGPAGSVAATLLARGGARVLMVDRAAFPRHKLCGDTINPGTLAIFRRLNLAATFEPRALRVDGMVVTGERGVAVRGAYPSGLYGLAVVRRELDAALAEAAVAAGVRFEDRVLVKRALVDGDGSSPRVHGIVMAGRDGREVRVPAPIVIAADGRRSRLAFGLGLARHPPRPRRWAAGAYFEGAAAESAFGEMHVRRGRYVGVASLPGGLTNVCVVTSHQEGLHDPAAMIRGTIERDAYLRERLRGARMVGSPSVLGPLAVETSAAGVPGLLLAGDAAGFIDPMTGDGLRFAVRGAELAAGVVLETLGRHTIPSHTALARARRREFATKWRFNHILRALVSSSAAVGIAERVAARAPSWLERTILFAGDVGGITPDQPAGRL